jgi:glycosyltransferase involved in cell wall biosynthesis
MPTLKSNMHSWENNSELLHKQIIKNKAPFKIILKTKNEHILLDKWIAHYERFLAPSEIIIADNCSDDPRVLKTYQELDTDYTIFRYQSNPANGAHNCIHDSNQFEGLFKALNDSCEYYLLVDTDELLLIHDKTSWTTDRDNLLEILKTSKKRAICTSWFETVPFSDDTVYIGRDNDRLIEFLAWGKPVLPSGYTSSGFRIHNVQHRGSLFTTQTDAFLMLLHLKNFHPEQRLSTNRLKLLARGLISPHLTYEDISALSFDELGDPTAVRLVNEIKEIMTRNDASMEHTNEDDRIRFAPSGKFAFTTTEANLFFENYCDNFGKFQNEAFNRYVNYSD